MWWVIVGGAVLTVLVIGLWLLAPTVRTFRRPDFEPTSTDDLSIYRAQSSADSHGGGQ